MSDENDMKSVKAIGDYRLEVLGVPFGSPSDRDSDGQYFDAGTNVHQDKYPTIPAVYYHGRDENGRAMDKPEYFGTAKHTRTDAQGHWYEVILDKTKQYAQRVWEAAKNGIAMASSGSAPHLVRIAKDGQIKEWAVMELSIFDTGDGRQPSNRHAVVMPMMKAIYAEAGIELPDQPHPEDAGNAADDKQNNTTNLTGAMKMDETKGITQEDVQAQIAAALKAEREANEAAVKAAKDFDDAVEVKAAAKVEAMKAEMVKGRRLPDFDGVAPFQTQYHETRKFDGLDAGSTAVLIGALKSAGKPVSEGALNALSLKLMEDKTEVGKEGQYAMKSAGIKAGEINYSTSSGYGDEWVGIAYSTTLWESIRVNTFVINKLPQIEVPQGMESIYLPLESTDPVWYNVAENTVNGTTTGSPAPTVTSSRIATGRQLLTLAKLGARVTWSGEMEESSLIPFAAQVRNQLGMSGAEYLESAIIDGDTETTDSTNINNIGGAEVTGGHYLAFDGFRKSCLVTTTANSRAGGTLDVTDFLETAKLMGGAGINALDTSKVSFIIDPNVNWKFIALPEFLTRDVSGNPTLEGGKLSQIWGYGVDISGSMHFMSAVRKANAAGKVNTTTAVDNIYGAILAVRWDQWKFGWRRRMTMETTRFANSDTNEIVAMIRVGLKQRDTEASAITYGVTV